MKTIDYFQLKHDAASSTKSAYDRMREQFTTAFNPAVSRSDDASSDVFSEEAAKPQPAAPVERKRPNPMDSHAFVSNGDEVDASIKVTAPPDYKPKTASPHVSSSSKSSSSSLVDDEDLESFKQEFDETEDEDYVDDSDIDRQKYVKPVQTKPAPIVDDDYEDDDFDDDPGYSDENNDESEIYSAEAEARRREEEARLRLQTQSSNQKNKPKPKSMSTKKQQEDTSKTSYLRAIPKNLVDRIRDQFPGANSNDEAVAAYMYVKEGRPVDLYVSDRIREVADSYCGETMSVKNAQDEILKAIMQLSLQVRALGRKSNAIELAAAFQLFDYMGFRKKSQNEPSEVDFLEKGINELINNLEKSSEVKAMKDKNRAGSLTIINRDLT